MRITFLLPHQRRTTGGVALVHEAASRLAARHEVVIAVRWGEPRSIAGCTVLSIDDATPSDFVVVPGDWTGPSPAGRQVCYLMGFGTPGNPVVANRLEQRLPVIAISSWLAGEARSRGCRAVHVPVGVDRSVFRPGRQAGERAPWVLMLTHDIEWKGTADGIEAIRTVCRDRPDIEVTFFGRHDPEAGFLFVDQPRPVEVAQLMRESAVFVCASWEEGLGLPGLEAMACGAAVATTDTKGGRDYAQDQVTALVTEPRAPADLAGAIGQLLDDRELRERIARGGLDRAASFPTWDESASLFEEALLSF